MRILQLCNRVPWPARDGGAIAMLNTTRAFHQLGQQVYLMCLNTKKHQVEEAALPDIFRELGGFEAVNIDTDVKPWPALRNLLFSSESYHISRFF